MKISWHDDGIDYHLAIDWLIISDNNSITDRQCGQDRLDLEQK